MMEFEEEISNLHRLRELMPFDESSGSALKVTNSLNDVARRFIALCPFISEHACKTGLRTTYDRSLLGQTQRTSNFDSRLSPLSGVA